MNRCTWFFTLDKPVRTRPMDWSSVVARDAPSQLIAYLNRHSQDRRHHWNDPEWVNGVRLEPFIDVELLRIRGGAAKLMPGVEVH